MTWNPKPGDGWNPVGGDNHNGGCGCYNSNGDLNEIKTNNGIIPHPNMKTFNVT